MREVGHAVKLQYGDAAELGLVDGPFEILERPGGTSIAGRGNQERMIETRFIREAPAFLVRELGRSATPGKFEPERFENWQRARLDAVARKGEHRRSRQSEFDATVVDRLDLFFQSREVLLVDRHVVAGVVADLEAVPVEMGDLLPGHVVLLVALEIESFGDEERRPEVVLQQNRPHDR